MEALDAVFSDPPRSTEQLLHPERLQAGDSPIEVPIPDAAGVALTEGVMGEWSLVELLNAELAPADARRAAEGWGGDRYVLVAESTQTCVVLLIRMDTEQDADELLTAFRRWVGRQSDATVERTDGTSLQMMTCHAIA